MELILIRHGIAAPHGVDDRERPLTEEGIDITAKIAKNLSDYLPEPTAILDSGLRRATETADLFFNVYKKSQRGVLPSLQPGGDSVRLGKDLQKYRPDDVIFLVGHEPDMGRHASYFLTGHRLSFCAFKRAGVMWIEFEGQPVEAQGNLKCYLPPSLSKNVRPKK